jgi:hypothetical protein
VVGTVVAVLTKSAAKLGYDDDHLISPSRRSDLLREACKRTAEFAESVGKIAVRPASIDMGVPAAHVNRA